MSETVMTNFKQPKAKKPQKQRQNWSEQCDTYCGRIVRSRGYCQVCGARGPGVVLQWAHGFSRRYRNVRWDERNGFCACAKCHWKYTHDDLRWKDWLREQWGDALYDELWALAISDDKALKPNVKTLAKELAARWDDLKLRIEEAS